MMVKSFFLKSLRLYIYSLVLLAVVIVLIFKFERQAIAFGQPYLPSPAVYFQVELPDDWDDLTPLQKATLNPYQCLDTTQIRADNGQCLKGGSNLKQPLEDESQKNYKDTAIIIASNKFTVTVTHVGAGVLRYALIDNEANCHQAEFKPLPSNVITIIKGTSIYSQGISVKQTDLDQRRIVCVRAIDEASFDIITETSYTLKPMDDSLAPVESPEIPKDNNDSHQDEDKDESLDINIILNIITIIFIAILMALIISFNKKKIKKD